MEQDYCEFFFCVCVCVCVGGGGNNRNKKWDMLSGALFATLSQRQNTPHTFYFSVPSRKITH